MKLLVDTHVWLWWQMAPERLGTDVRQAIGSVENDVYLSAVSSWEMAIKIVVGKLRLPKPLADMVQESLLQDGFINLPLQHAHCFTLGGLPMYHRDPFDRMLVAQAITEDCWLVSADQQLARYPVRLTPAG